MSGEGLAAATFDLKPGEPLIMGDINTMVAYKGAIYQDVHVLVNGSSHLVPDGVILWERCRRGPPQRSAAERFTGLRPAGKRLA